MTPGLFESSLSAGEDSRDGNQNFGLCRIGRRAPTLFQLLQLNEEGLGL